MKMYMGAFAEMILNGRLRFGVEILNVVQIPKPYWGGWTVSCKNRTSGTESRHHYGMIIVCTGVCNIRFSASGSHLVARDAASQSFDTSSSFGWPQSVSWTTLFRIQSTLI